MGHYPHHDSRLSPVKTLNLLLWFHLIAHTVASPAATPVAESKEEEVDCPLLPSSPPSTAAFEVLLLLKPYHVDL